MNPSASSTPSINQGPKTAASASNPTTNSNVIKRLQSELLTLMTSPTPGISAFPSSTTMTTWDATITGPSDTVYAAKTFKLTLAYPPNYPYAPPEVLFKTPVYHPNVDFSGRICLSVLERKNEEGVGWSAALNTGMLLLSIQSLLGEPNPASPLNAEAGRLWEEDKEEYKRKVEARHQEPEELEANGL
ncbi:ubiquitin-conjugating enzyme E2-C [Teratosphaeria destructans]|uniref:Ubiquitin-conjugating enzyme E2 2 n=1 Tax=Teratosphaeria destructans TaxID=418781 RepID=A0A9W7SPF7_9PEZI|nr:ubiquitin-conjugating enzyme E2-C [Teratosphaeria destructans]